MRATWALIGSTAFASLVLTAIVLCKVSESDVRATYISAIVGFAGVIITLLSQSLIEAYSDRRKRLQLRKSIQQIVLGNCRQLEEVLPRLMGDLDNGQAISIPRGQTEFALGAIRQHVADLVGDAPSSDFVALAHFIENVGFMIQSSPDLPNRSAVQVHDNFFIIEPAAAIPARRAFDHILKLTSQLRQIIEQGRDLAGPPPRIEI